MRISIFFSLFMLGCTYQINERTGFYTEDACEQMRAHRAVSNMVTAGATAASGLAGAALAGGLDSSSSGELNSERNVSYVVVGAAVAAGVAQAVRSDMDDRLEERCLRMKYRHFYDAPPESAGLVD